MTPSAPHRGYNIHFHSSHQLLSHGIEPLMGFLSALQPHCVRCLPDYRATTKKHWSSAEFPGHRKEQLTQTFTDCLLKTHLFSLIFNLGGGPGPPLGPLDANYI